MKLPNLVLFVSEHPLADDFASHLRTMIEVARQDIPSVLLSDQMLPVPPETVNAAEALLIFAVQDDQRVLDLLESTLSSGRPPVLVVGAQCSDRFAARIYRHYSQIAYLALDEITSDDQLLISTLNQITDSITSPSPDYPITSGIAEIVEIIQGVNTGEIDTLLLHDSSGRPVPFVREGADAIYRLQLEALTVGALLTDTDEHILSLNPTAVRWLGRPAHTLIGQPLFRSGLSIETSLPEGSNYALPIRRYLPLPGVGAGRTGQISDLGTLRLPPPPGRPNSEAAVARLWLITDVTEELHLRQRDHFLATLLARLHDGVIVTGFSGELTYWNAQAGTLIGWRPTPDAHLPHAIDDLPAAHELLTGLQQARAGRNVRIEWERSRDAGDGADPRWIELSASPLRNAHGIIEGMLAIVRDVTAQKLLEENIQLLHQQTRNAYSRLHVATEELLRTERLRVLGQMASGIAHDFNNVLTPIMGYAELALSTPNLAQGVRDDLMRIAGAARDASAIITRLRSFYRPQPENLIHQPVELPAVVCEAIALTRPRWRDIPQAHGHLIEILTAFGSIPPVPGDPVELRELLINLIFNAVDAMPQGGTITISTTQRNNQIVLEVSDNGVGISDDVRQHLFEPFFTTKGERGSGLGLTICQGIAERHQAQISLESIPGSGTCFTIAFPISKPVEEQSSSEHIDQLPGYNILYIDDDPGVRTVIGRLLESLGQFVESVASGSEALDMLHILRFDILITDLGMPQLSGDTIITAARQIDPSLTVVLLTGWGQFIEDQGTIGADYLLNKPVKREDLSQVLAAIARHHKALSITRVLDRSLPGS